MAERVAVRLLDRRPGGGADVRKHDARPDVAGELTQVAIVPGRPNAVEEGGRVLFAVPTDACNELLFRMLRSRMHLAIIRDAEQRIVGLVTLEDLLEELVGDIHDEHDEPASVDVGHSRHAAVLDASMPASEVAARFDAQLPEWVEDRAQPLAGLIVRALGRIPVVGERFVLGSLELTVVRATPTRIQRLLAQRTEAGAPVALRAPK